MVKYHKTIIVGAGPGGLQTAITMSEIAEKNGEKADYIILESGSRAGTFFEKYPVHGTLISNNKLYTGMDPKSSFAERFDWNSLVTESKKIQMRNYSREFFPPREAIHQMLNDLVEEYDLNIEYDTVWESTKKADDGAFFVKTSKGTYRCDQLVIATGLKPAIPDIDGFELTTLYPDMKEKSYYRDKKVLILGKGNSAGECAQDILNEANVIMMASNEVTRLAYKTHYVGDLRAVNSLLVDNYQLKHQAALLDCHIRKIEKIDGKFHVTVEYLHAKGEIETLMFDEIVSATGFKPNIQDLVEHFNLKIVNMKYPSITGEFESTEVENLFFAGTITHGIDYRKTFSGFIHGFRYNSKVLAHVLSERNGLSTDKKEISNDDIVKHIQYELTHDSDIYLQPGFIIKVYEYSENKWIEHGYTTLPTFLSNEYKQPMLSISLEYGDIGKFPDPLNIERTPGDSSESVHIHPILRIKHLNGSVEKIDLEEHLENNFMMNSIYEENITEFLSKISLQTAVTE